MTMQHTRLDGTDLVSYGHINERMSHSNVTTIVLISQGNKTQSLTTDVL